VTNPQVQGHVNGETPNNKISRCYSTVNGRLDLREHSQRILWEI